MSTILIIDDDIAFREMMSLVLGEEHFEVLETDGGEQGVACARAHLPDLIICDVHMAGMDGYETLAALRAEAATATIPFILMTGRADPRGMRAGMNLGADDYLHKPFTMHELLAAVNARLAKHQVVRDQAERKVAALRSSLTTALPHELHTPLSGILASAQILHQEADTMPREEVREMAELICLAGQRLQRLIENGLIFAQLEALARDPEQAGRLRQAVLREPDVSVHSAVRDKSTAHGRRDDLRLSLQCCPVAISGSYLVKIVEELIDNACKFSEPGTAIRVTLQPVGDYLELCVVDQGSGMDAEHIADMGAFIQFKRDAWEQQGSGLGLAIVKELVSLHNGRLDLESRPGMGTQVRVRLPIPIGRRPLRTPKSGPQAKGPDHPFQALGA